MKMYAFACALRTQFFEHGSSDKPERRRANGRRGSMAPRGDTQFAAALLDALAGRGAHADPARRRTYVERWNAALPRRREMRHEAAVLVPTEECEALALPLCDRIWEAFATRDAVLLMTASFGPNFATMWNADLMKTPQAQALEAWMWELARPVAVDGGAGSLDNADGADELRAALRQSLSSVFFSVAAARRKQVRRNQLKCHDPSFRAGVHAKMMKRESLSA